MSVFKRQNSVIHRTWKHKTIFARLSLLSLVLLLALTGCSTSKGASDTVVVATKGFAESDILANAISLLIQNDTKLKTKIVTMDNNLLWQGIQGGEVDTYVEYTGTALLNMLKEKPEYDPQKVYDIVKEKMKEQYQIEVLDQIGFNDTYALTLRKEIAEKYNIKTTSELAEHAGEAVFGTSQDFIKREDTWPLLEKAYNLQFKEIKTIQNNSMAYQAIQQGLIDVSTVYTTDSKILTGNFIVLEDDKNVFVPYFAIPLIREETLEKHPELRDVINKLAGTIDDSKMQNLNSEVESKKRPALDVAKEWLKSEGLL
jgi:osmoprotectant transport system substrate-binding protein